MFLIELLYKKLCRDFRQKTNYPIKQGGPRSGFRLPEKTMGVSEIEKGGFFVSVILIKSKSKN